MEINRNLQKYIEDEILPSYEKNDSGHNLEHIMYVIERSLKFASTIRNSSDLSMQKRRVIDKIALFKQRLFHY